jgi:type I restriction enzyme M protein
MNAFGKAKPLTVADFESFDKAYGKDPVWKARRKDEGQEGRFRFFERKDISARNDNLDIAWLRDTSNDPEDEMTEPDELSAAIMTHLKTALEEMEAFNEELKLALTESA